MYFLVQPALGLGSLPVHVIAYERDTRKERLCLRWQNKGEKGDATDLGFKGPGYSRSIGPIPVCEYARTLRSE
jgi:hypothetical protein